MQNDNSTLKVKFEYSVSNDEENIAFKEFQKKYVLKSNIIRTILFALIGALFIQQVIKNPDYTLGWGLIGVCVAFIFFIWYNPYKIRKSLLRALKEIENDIYEFELYDDYFSIKTIFCENKEEIASISELEDKEEEQQEIPPRIVYFNKEPFEVVEIEEMFVIFMKRQTIYVLPKRCISEKQQQDIREVLSEKIGEDFISKIVKA